MKITKSYLKQIIKEELNNLEEANNVEAIALAKQIGIPEADAVYYKNYVDLFNTLNTPGVDTQARKKEIKDGISNSRLSQATKIKLLNMFS